MNTGEGVFFREYDGTNDSIANIETYPQVYQHGDIFGVPNRHILGKLNKAIFWPHTDLYHFGIIADYIQEENDYVILESINKGIAVGRLSWYNGTGFRVFRINGPEAQALGQRACQALTQYGRARYDFALFAKILFGCFEVWGRHLANVITGKSKIGGRQLYRWWEILQEELPYARNSRFICTEAANEAWRIVGSPIIPDGIIKLPAGFIRALWKKRLIEVMPDGQTRIIRFGWWPPSEEFKTGDIITVSEWKVSNG